MSKLENRNLFLAIEGCIASGKSTTARIVAEHLNLPFLLEETERHPFLEKFYEDPSRYAIETELAFVLGHYHQLCGVSEQSIITDFTPAKDLVFARMNLKGRDLELFETVYDALTSRVRLPDLTIFLDLPVEELSKRVASRGRPYEVGISRSYLANLREVYSTHLHHLGRSVHTITITPEATAGEVAERVIRIVKHFDKQRE